MFRIVTFADEHLGEAAHLAAGRYKTLRTAAPLLPASYEETDTLLPLLREISAAAPGVAALRGGRLVGFLLAWMLPAHRGQRTVYSPEWTNGAESDGGRGICEALYAVMAARWATEPYLDHDVTVLAHDRDAIAATCQALAKCLARHQRPAWRSAAERPPIYRALCRCGLAYTDTWPPRPSSWWMLELSHPMCKLHTWRK